MINPDFIWTAHPFETQLYIRNPAIEFSFCFEPYLFNTARHQNSQLQNTILTFLLKKDKVQKPIAVIHLTQGSDHCYRSPSSAPFGGVQCARNCDLPELLFFMGCIEKWILTREGKRITIKTAPSCYTAKSHIQLHQMYCAMGFSSIYQHLNHHIEVSRIPFYQTITNAERRRLKKSVNAGFDTVQYKADSFSTIYEFLKTSYENKNYNLSMTRSRLEALITEFPDDCIVFAVKDKDRIIALSLTVRINKTILYNFLPAALAAYNKFSPSVMLTQAIYEYCQHENITILDLGISLDQNGLEKPGLLHFKKNIGGKDSLKICYQKDILK